MMPGARGAGAAAPVAARGDAAPDRPRGRRWVLGILGGKGVRIEGPPPAPGAPRIRIRAYWLLGGTDVRTPRGGRRRLLGGHREPSGG